MKNVSGTLGLNHRKSPRFGLLLVSAILILSASALVYSRTVYETPLNVGNTGGGPTGSGPTASAGENFPPAIIAVMAASAFVISISLFLLLREAYKHVNKAPIEPDSSPADPGFMPVSEGEHE